MPRLMIIGATGSLGSAVAREAVSAGHEVSLLVRTPSKLNGEIASQASVRPGDLTRLAAAELADLIRGHDVLINCAGLVTEGQAFVELFDRVVSSAETLSTAERPVSWFLAGAALLDLDERGTAQNPLRSRPSSALTATTLAIVVGGVALPFSSLAQPLGFTPLPLRHPVPRVGDSRLSPARGRSQAPSSASRLRNSCGDEGSGTRRHDAVSA